jgi:hypothetical protein
MSGAYCLHCREAGPDLQFTPPDALGGLPLGRVATIRFTCGRCQQRWIWTVRHAGGGKISYHVEQRATAIGIDVELAADDARPPTRRQ